MCLGSHSSWTRQMQHDIYHLLSLAWRRSTAREVGEKMRTISSFSKHLPGSNSSLQKKEDLSSRTIQASLKCKYLQTLDQYIILCACATWLMYPILRQEMWVSAFDRCTWNVQPVTRTTDCSLKG